MKKGILGVPKDPKNRVLVSFNRWFDDWPSTDSDDSDYKPEDSSSNADVDVILRKQNCRKRIKASDNNLDTVHDASGYSDKDLWGKCIPQLVLLKIFHHVVESSGAIPFLCRAQRVCRLWYQCAGDSTLWKTVDLSYGWIKANDATLQLLCDTHFSKLTEINLSNWKLLTVNGLKLLADSCPRLKSINLSHCRVNSIGVLYMIHKCSHLAEIELMAYGCADVVSAKVVVQIVCKCSQKLRSLNLSSNPLRGYNAVLKALAVYCPNLECLDLSQTINTSISVNFDIEQLQRGCPKLRILRLMNTLIAPTTVSLRDRNESPGFPELQELSFSIDPSVSGFMSTGRSIVCSRLANISGRNGNVLCRLTKTSQKLKLLDISGWSCVTCGDLQSLPATDLVTLYMSHCSVERMDTLAAKWQHSLVELDVSWNVHFEAALDVAVCRLASNPAMSKLEVLDLRGTSVSIHSVLSLLQGCPVLRNLNLSSCRSLPRGIKREYFNESLENLRQNIDSVAGSDVSQ